MDVDFADDDLRRLYTERDFNAGYGTDIISSFRKKMQLLVNAQDERDLRAWNSLHYKQLKGDRKHQWTVRLNGPWRLVLEKRVADGVTTLVVVAIENKH
jgi:proteic killer suppression protein